MKKWMLWADVVQVHTPNPLAELACVVNEVQTPMVVTYHCDVVRKQLMQKVYRPVTKRLLHRADKITVSTPNHLKYSEILQEFKAKSEVIPFGVRAKHAELTPAIRAEVEKLKELYGEYFLFVGRLVPYKGVDVLLKAMTRVNGNLVIVGQGPRWEGWSQLSNDLKLSDRVHFAGRVDDDNQFAAYLHGCHTLVLPSVSEAEAFGIVLIEAMSCGKPIITTELKSGVPWVNDKGVTGLEVKPKDDLALAEALTQMSQNEMMRRQMGQAARQRFENNFTVNKMVDAYCNLYSRLSGQELLQAA